MAPPLRAQSPAPARAAAARTITAADVRRRIGIIADDSMLGRDTPSRGLELTAAYIAGEFRRLGLRPAGDGGDYIQRYPIERRQLLTDSSRVVIREHGETRLAVSFANGAVRFSGAVPDRPIRGPLLVLDGPIEPDRITPAAFRNRIVVLPVNLASMPASVNPAIAAMHDAGALAVVAVIAPDSVELARLAARTRAPRTARPGAEPESLPVVGVLQAKASARLPPAAALEAPEGWEAELTLRDTVLQRASAPNVAGILEGTDRALAAQYVVYSAHMDHIGITHGAADSINNGADDDASGTAGVLELAEAFAQPGARPRRSIIFLAVSGEEKGLWGSNWFTAHPPVPLAAMAADLNLDMIGRNWRDTVAVVGLEHSDLARRLRRTEAAHPELRMHAIPDPWPEEHIFFRSDHYNFARRGVPILFFTSGLHQDYHRPSDSADKIENDKEARLLRLLFWLGADVGDDPARPKWNPESYRTIVGR